MKKVIQRSLPLNVKYTLVGVSYLSLEDGGGCSCDNCGKLITNIAAIKSDRVYNIGLDCLDSILLNNDLLNGEDYFKYQYSDKPAIAKAKSLRAKILKKSKEDPYYFVTFKEFKNCFGFSFYTKRQISGNVYDDPQGFDYTFNLAYKDLTLNYLKGIGNITMLQPL